MYGKLKQAKLVEIKCKVFRIREVEINKTTLGICLIEFVLENRILKVDLVFWWFLSICAG